MPETGVCALVLAAGRGTRYRAEQDVDKLLAPAWRDDPRAPATLLATCRALAGVTEHLRVVIRADNLPLRRLLDDHLPAEALLAVDSQGLGDSLARAVARAPAARGWLVALGDMPYVRRDSLVRIAAAIAPRALVLPCHQGRPGHPRGIGSAHREALLALAGERGAQALFAGPGVTRLALDDPGLLEDIDRPGDRRARA